MCGLLAETMHAAAQACRSPVQQLAACYTCDCDLTHVCTVCVQALFVEVAGLKRQVQQLSDLLQTVVPSLPPSPSSSRMMSSP
jgi:hypothetical protein